MGASTVHTATSPPSPLREILFMVILTPPGACSACRPPGSDRRDARGGGFRRGDAPNGREAYGRSGAAAVAEELDVEARAIGPVSADALGGEPLLRLEAGWGNALGHKEDVGIGPAGQAREERLNLGQVERAGDDELELARGVGVEKLLERGIVEAMLLVAGAQGAGRITRVTRGGRRSRELGADRHQVAGDIAEDRAGG